MLSTYNSLKFVYKRGIEAFILLFNLLPLNKPKAVMVCLDPFTLQTLTALIKSFCGGSRGAVFSKRAPLAGGKYGTDRVIRLSV
jgi:hypothetical protein